MLSITVSFNLNKCFPFLANESHSKYESREVEREFVIITVQKRTTNKQTYSWSVLPAGWVSSIPSFLQNPKNLDTGEGTVLEYRQSVSLFTLCCRCLSSQQDCYWCWIIYNIIICVASTLCFCPYSKINRVQNRAVIISDFHYMMIMVKINLR